MASIFIVKTMSDPEMPGGSKSQSYSKKFHLNWQHLQNYMLPS